MFEETWDRLSFLGSFRWPVAIGEITSVFTDRFAEDRTRLIVDFMFYVNGDGPYSGETSWEPLWAFNSKRALIEGRKKLRVKKAIRVRYRPDDPSINTGTKGLRELLR